MAGSWIRRTFFSTDREIQDPRAVSDAIRHELLDAGLDDLLQMFEVVSIVHRHVGGKLEHPLVRATTLEVLGDMLGRGELIAGYVDKDPEDGLLYVRSWGLAPHEAVEKIDRDWPRRRRLTGLGEVAWFELTDAGRNEIHRLSTLDQEEQELVQEVVGRRRPDLSECVGLIGEGKLMWPQRQALHEVLAEELDAVGAESAYGRQLEDLRDRALVF